LNWPDVLAAIRAVLDDEWTEATVGYQNEDFQATPGSPWVYAEVLPVTNDAAHFGSVGLRPRSDLGLIACHVFTPTGTGAAEGFRLAEALGDLLQLRSLGPGAVTEAATITGAGSADDEGNWFRSVCTVPIGIHKSV
jgi:hypothetical protein